MRTDFGMVFFPQSSNKSLIKCTLKYDELKNRTKYCILNLLSKTVLALKQQHTAEKFHSKLHQSICNVICVIIIILCKYSSDNEKECS